MASVTIDPKQARSLLVILPTWVGDFVMATPALRAIRTRFPNARITLLAESNLNDLIRGGDWMNNVVNWPAKKQRSLFHRAYRDLVRDLRGRQFDLAILLPNSFRAALLAWLIGAKRRAGFDRDGRGWLLTDRILVPNRADEPKRTADTTGESENRSRQTLPFSLAAVPESVAVDGRGSFIGTTRNHSDESGTINGTITPRILLHPPAPPGPYQPMPIVDYYAELVTALGCPRPGDDLELFTTDDCEASVENRLVGLNLNNHHPLVVISPGARYGAAKCWPPERFAAVADRLIQNENAAVVITCGPGEEHIARAIADHMTQAAHVFTDPGLTLGELKSLIRRADLLLCNDAGPRHFARAFRIPVVTIFGPTHPDWTATSYPHERLVRVDVDCGPCQQRVCPLGHLKCMTDIDPGVVHGAASELLRLTATTQRHEKARG